MLYIGIDVGTQRVKGVVLDPAGKPGVIARAERPLALLPEQGPGAAEQHPDDWWDAVVAVIRQLGSAPAVERHAVAAIGVSGQQHGAVFVDAADRVVRPAKLWCDTSTVAEAREIAARIGRHVPVGFTASKVAWLARVEPQNWKRTTGVLLPHDFINLRLTGVRAAEAGDASGTGWFDVGQRTWDAAAVAAVHPDLAPRLPRLLADGEAIGTLSGPAAATLGLAQQVLVAPGGGDNMMSAIGAGATRNGVVVLSLGTSGTVFSRSERPVVDPAGLVAPFCSSDGAWLPLLCVMNCTNVMEEVRRAYLPDAADGLARLTQWAQAVEPGAGGLTFVPFLHGERVPDLPEATGTLYGLRPGCLAPGFVFRAALEGVTANIALGVRRLEALGIVPRSLRLVGGGAQNPLWRRMIADALALPVIVNGEAEAAALGAALQALWVQRRQVDAALGADEVVATLLPPDMDRIDPDSRAAAFWDERIASFGDRVSHEWGVA